MEPRRLELISLDTNGSVLDLVCMLNETCVGKPQRLGVQSAVALSVTPWRVPMNFTLNLPTLTLAIHMSGGPTAPLAMLDIGVRPIALVATDGDGRGAQREMLDVSSHLRIQDAARVILLARRVINGSAVNRSLTVGFHTASLLGYALQSFELEVPLAAGGGGRRMLGTAAAAAARPLLNLSMESNKTSLRLDANVFVPELDFEVVVPSARVALNVVPGQRDAKLPCGASGCPPVQLVWSELRAISNRTSKASLVLHSEKGDGRLLGRLLSDLVDSNRSSVALTLASGSGGGGVRLLLPCLGGLSKASTGEAGKGSSNNVSVEEVAIRSFDSNGTALDIGCITRSTIFDPACAKHSSSARVHAQLMLRVPGVLHAQLGRTSVRVPAATLEVAAA